MIQTGHHNSSAGEILTAVRNERLALSGSILLSITATLPLHLTPLIIITILADGLAGVERAALVISALLAGQLGSSFFLPFFGINAISRTQALSASVVLLVSMTFTSLGTLYLMPGWFLVGVSCGVLRYLGTLNAIHYSRTTFAFSIRLGLVLLVAGCFTAILASSGADYTYDTLICILVFGFAIILGIGHFFYKPLANSIQPEDANPTFATNATNGKIAKTFPQSTAVFALIVLFFLFVGQTGFITFALQDAINRGFDRQEVLYAMIGMKICAGIFLIMVARFGGSNQSALYFAPMGIILVIGLAVTSRSTELIMLFIGLLAFEIAFNDMSAKFQGRIVFIGYVASGRWLNAVIMIGAVCGPLVHGFAIASGAGSTFIIFAAGAAMLPLCFVTSSWIKSHLYEPWNSLHH